MELFLSEELYKHPLFPASGDVLFFIGEKDGGMAECLDLWVPNLSHLKEVLLRVPSTPH